MKKKKKKCDALTKVFTDIINLSASKAFQPKMGKKGRVSGEGKWWQKSTDHLPEQDKCLLMKTCRIVLSPHYSELLQVRAQDLVSQILWL